MAPFKADRLSLDTTVYLIHHIVFPPKLPQADDHNDAHQESMLEIVVSALQSLHLDTEDNHVKESIASGFRAIQCLQNTRDQHGHVAEPQLREALQQISSDEGNKLIAVEIKAQNAGLVASRRNDDIVFESFELSPVNKAIMEAKGRLVRDFPTSAAKISIGTVRDKAFTTSLAYTITKMTTQIAPDTRPRVSKGGHGVDENRDTTHPMMVTDWLMNYITALGDRSPSNVITKHTREEVLWNRCELPWRRAPLWLLVRVTLQIHFTRQGNTGQSLHGLYKAFMVQLLLILLESAQIHWNVLGSEALYFLCAKISRRFRKMEVLGQLKSMPSQWATKVKASTIHAHSLIHQSWTSSSTNSQANIGLASLRGLQPSRDLNMVLPELETFLESARSRKRNTKNITFEPSESFPTYLPSKLPSNIDASGEYKLFQLAAVETWVNHHLASWLSGHIQKHDTCGRLRHVIEDYHGLASVTYARLPAAVSQMYLTVPELWVACDRSACYVHPLLSQYSPEITLEELQCLVLPNKNQMGRLAKLEHYVQSRHEASTTNKPSIFRDFGKISSFAVRYFDQSVELQNLYADIERTAAENKRKKCEELATLQRQYQNLIDRYNSESCEYYKTIVNLHDGHTTTEHSSNCARCRCKTRADKLDIGIYEWPLSSDLSTAKATVFEVRIPQAFSDWRDASRYLISTVLGCHENNPVRPQYRYTLDNHHGLSGSLSTGYSSQRIIILSHIKPHAATHRKRKIAIPRLQEIDVCPQNALRYAYFDNSLGRFTGLCGPTEYVAVGCRYIMPGSVSKPLERFLFRPPSAPDGLPPNEVVASVCDCPINFSIDEFKAFASLSLGRNILYFNILAQLAAPILDFSKAEVQLLILQVIGQVGVPAEHGDLRRISHVILAEESFGHAMLEQLEVALSCVSENWESWRASATYVTVARRILSLTLSKGVFERSLAFLVEARRASKKWLERLVYKAGLSSEEKQRNDLQTSATEVALLCVSTFDVEEDLMDNVLDEKSAAFILLHSSIFIQENLEVARAEYPEIYNMMVHNWRCLMYRALPKLRKSLLEDNTGLNDAVRAHWLAFREIEGTCWKTLSEKSKHWLCIKSGTLTVHFNLIPQSCSQPIYKPLFQNSTIEVIPSDLPGMKFSAKSAYRGYELHFGLEGEEMYVVAIDDHCTLDLLPARLFVNRIPIAFVNNYIHWYDHGRNEVIFRPRKDPWSSKNAKWKLVYDQNAWRMVDSADTLMGLSSHAACTLSRIFEPFEDKHQMYITWNATTQTICIALPRLQLDFFIEHGNQEIQSRQYCGRIVDANQNIGVLVGLKSKLVLKSASQSEQRVVLVPATRTYGSAAIAYRVVSSQHYVTVSISKDEARGVYAYFLDRTLGRILTTEDMQRNLYLAYLHAITSHCLPDLLTGFTGTESALQILRSAALRSFQYLTPHNMELLQQLSYLSPTRAFYPRYLREMQSVEWDRNLPVLSQHPQFGACVRDIVYHAQRMRIFYPKAQIDISGWRHHDPYLTAREAIRSSTFRVCGYGAEQFSSNSDLVYESRVHLQSEKGNHAYITTALVSRDHAALHMSPIDFKDRLLQTHFGKSAVSGPSQDFDPVILQYDACWLEDFANIMRKYWCNIHKLLPKWSVMRSAFDIAAWLSLMAFASPANLDIVQILATMYRVHAFTSIHPPSASAFFLHLGYTYDTAEIRTVLQKHCKPFDWSTESELAKTDDETPRQHENRINRLFQGNRKEAIDTIVTILQNQWPCAVPTDPVSWGVEAYVDVSGAMKDVRIRFSHWDLNRRFSEYLKGIIALLAKQKVNAVHVPPSIENMHSSQPCVEDDRRSFAKKNIFRVALPAPSQSSPTNRSTAFAPPCEPVGSYQEQCTSPDNELTELRVERLCDDLERHAKSVSEKQYVADLRASCVSLQDVRGDIMARRHLLPCHDVQALYKTHLEACVKYLESLTSIMVQTVVDRGLLSDELGLRIQQAPRLSPTFWLQQLHRDRFTALSDEWRQMIIDYGLAVTHFQRAQRLEAVSKKSTDLVEELRHLGHSNWEPKELPEMLLLEAESGIMIRREQEFIASQMRNVQDGHNIALQLLMGGGKSSVIVPILVSHLTDKKKLVRVIVAKPQSRQMRHMLVAKVGHMLNRRVYYMPFSRDLRPSSDEASLIREMCTECIEQRGVLLIQPEHILSFKLMAVEAKLAGHSCASLLLDTHEFLEEVSRDIVDESDENFSVKFELVYTMGSQRVIELAPERWLIIQAILGLVLRFAVQIQDKYPDAIEVQGETDGKFPRIRLLREDGADQLLGLVANHIVEFGIMGLPTSSQPPHVQSALLRYITQRDLSNEDRLAVESDAFWTKDTKSPILLIRGLLAGGVLRFALSTKRWRVNFGLDPSRVPNTPLAVPFRNKDSPSPRSEYSHEDVVIVLSLLSYYYGGLSDQQLIDSFTHLQKSDQAATKYRDWVTTASSALAVAYRELSGVSLKDVHQCETEIFPALRYSKNAIDYYLSSLVFPKAMREFPQKLSASGWDIGAIKKNPLTGFSGTNDTMHLLPLSVKHQDLPSQSHTNALVLAYLLQDENTVELLPARTKETYGKTDAHHILATIVKMKPEIRVVLDCGAAILEQNNKQVAQTWLQMTRETCQAVVFFEDEELSILDRMGRVESFMTSPFAQQLEVCLVYLDEAHTRGTDLRLPRNYRAAVTLGQALTKDKLTQGCMRMRKLGFGQSIAFLVPGEISSKILERSGGDRRRIEVIDVLSWAVNETWRDLKSSMPLWAIQGERFERHKPFLRGAATTFSQAQAFLEDEAQNLASRYQPQAQTLDSLSMLRHWDTDNANIFQIIARCQQFGALGFRTATLNEEQERELAPELEAERQIERPVRMTARKHQLHPSLSALVNTGELTAKTRDFVPAFESLAMTSAAPLFPLQQFPTDLIVTRDFMETVRVPSGGQASFVSDSYQRPIQYILSAKDANCNWRLIIISPFEANHLLPTIGERDRVTLHIYLPRVNADFAPLDSLQLFNVGRISQSGQIPRSLIAQLNLFSGSLYLRSFEEYVEICNFLGLLHTKPKQGQKVFADGFIDPPAGTWGLQTSPVPFLRTLHMKIRRESEAIEKTHIGKMLDGMRLEEKDF